MKAKELYPGIFSRHAGAYRQRMDELTARGEARGRMALLDCIAPKPGERVLDMACGPGTLTCVLARAVLPDGYGTDHGVHPPGARPLRPEINSAL